MVADDASKDGTAAAARLAPTSARDRIVVSFPKALCVGEAKNRAVKLARPLMDMYPWVAFFDDDDEMLPGRMSCLLDNMEAEGQKLGVGDWNYTEEGKPVRRVSGDWSIVNRSFGPPMTMVHRDLIPKDGNYFVQAPSDVHEDMVTHAKMIYEGKTWCYHSGAPVHHYMRRYSSFSGSVERGDMMRRNSLEFIERHYPSGSNTSIRSFCTVAFGKSVAETILLLQSLRMTGNLQPAVVLTDADGARVIGKHNLQGVECVRADLPALRRPFTDAPQRGHRSDVAMAAWLGKMQVIEEAAVRHGSALYLDSDFLVLRKYTDIIDSPIGLCPEHSRLCSDVLPTRWFSNERFGFYNAGMLYMTKDGASMVPWWRREYLSFWTRFGDDNGTHGYFDDQSCLNLLPLFSDVHTFHPGHNMMFTRVKPYVPEDIDQQSAKIFLKVHVGEDIFFRGWPIQAFHCHFRTEGRHTLGSHVYRQVLAMSKHPTHRALSELVHRSS